MSVGLNLVLVGSAALFAVGTFALVARRSTIVMVLGTQFMFAACGIAFVAFGRFGPGAKNQNAGAAMALFAGGVAVAELAVGLAMAAFIYREHRSFAVDADRG
jgi:NAD(P)H-quinone oxidoreductase subunit 4L